MKNRGSREQKLAQREKGGDQERYSQVIKVERERGREGEKECNDIKGSQPTSVRHKTPLTGPYHNRLTQFIDTVEIRINKCGG